MFFTALPMADRVLALAWWAILILRGLLPAAFAVAMGALVDAVQRGEGLAAPLGFVGLAFVLPWLGYSTWHLYTRLVDRGALPLS